MPRYTALSGHEIIKALSKLGFKVTAQRGSHIKMVRESSKKLVVTIVNEKELSPGVISSICKQAHITKKQLYGLIKE